MRFLVTLKSFVAVIGMATPVQADPGTSGPDPNFLATLTKAGITVSGPNCRRCGRHNGMRTDRPGQFPSRRHQERVVEQSGI